jgi:processive 1,2-diacylglycerol beta-glucosyltransferase
MPVNNSRKADFTICSLAVETHSRFPPLVPIDLLILTAGFGEGHNAAARGLLAAAQQLGISAEIADPYTALGSAYDRSRRDYLSLINRAPHVWAAMFRAIDRWPVVEFVLPALRPVKLELARILEEKQPRAVVSVYPVYPFLIRQLYATRRPFEFHTVITDSITINRVWHQAPSDSYIVPNAASGAVLREQGIPAGLIRELGFPVNPRFAANRPVRPSPDEGPRVLFMINAGKETAPDVVSCLVNIPRIQLSVTVGRDEDLRRRVEEAAAGRPIEIHGWINHMPELLMTHHVLIGKAGGAAVQETIAAQTPMLITQVVPGQEEGNAQLLFDHHCGALCPTPVSLAQRVEKLFANGAREWREWERNIQALSRPDAALRIVEELTAGG